MTLYFPSSPNVATTSRCEAYFKDLKHSDLGPDYQPTRADKFVMRHIKSIESISKLERATIKRVEQKTEFMQENIKRKRKISINETSDDYDHLKEQENWKGLNIEVHKKISKMEKIEIHTDKKAQHDSNSSNILQENLNLIHIINKDSINEDKENISPNGKTRGNTEGIIEAKPLSENRSNRHRGRYSKPCPDIHLIYGRPLRKRKDEVMKNGSKCDPVLINDKKIYVKNTCAFDSLIEILTTAYCNYSLFKQWIDENPENMFNICKKICY